MARRSRPENAPRKRKRGPEPEAVDILPDGMDLDPLDDAGDDPFAEAPEDEEAEPTGLASEHAEHMELVESSDVLTTPGVWLLAVLDGLVLSAGFVLIGAAITEPGLALYFGAGGAFALLAGGAMLFAMAQGRKRFRQACEACTYDIKRTVGPERVTYGDLVSARLDATACVFPPNVHVTLRDRPSPAFETVKKILIDGPGAVEYQAKATRRGDQAWDLVDVLVKDPGGLWRHTRTYRVPAHVTVDPGMASLTLRNMLTSRTAFPDGAPKALVNLFRDIEHDQLREYRGGDRMRDVDWKRMSSTGQMMVKDRIVESLNVGLLLIDAGTSMRLVDGGVRNLDHALEAASEIIQEAGRRNHQIGVLAFDDETVTAEMPPTRSRMLFHDSQQHFAKVAARHDEAHERAKEPVAVTLQRALRRMVGSQMGVLLFTDLETIDEGIIQVISRLGGDGAKVGVLVLPQPSMEAKRRAYRKHGTRPASGAYRGKGHRRELREVLSVQGIETMDLPVDRQGRSG